jgi:hypothetical protein
MGSPSALLSNSRIVTYFNLPLAAVTAWLLWKSLDWPLVGDAAILHFIARQMQMGAAPYRDIFDVNMPLAYFIHAAVVSVGGMGDVAWRTFDLAAAAVISGIILILVGPAGRAAAIMAILIVLITHLLLGAHSAGQRDYLMSIPALAATLVSAKAAEHPRRRWLHLSLAGAFAVAAASIKPSGLFLLFLPTLAMVRLRWREMMWIMVGASVAGLLVFGTLAALGGLWAFIAMIQGVLPLYAGIDTVAAPEIFKNAALWLAPTGGLALAAALSIAAPKPPRVRAMIGLTGFGLIHLWIQGKGWFYHVYPLGVGLACWGAWSLASLSVGRTIMCLIVTAATFVWFTPQLLPRPRMYPAAYSALAMQSALESRLPRGARVQMLGSDSGAFLAMARAGMRQATPHIQWFSLTVAGESVRRDFLAALEAAPPAAILLTNSQWPRGRGFEAGDNWQEFAALLASNYVIDQVGDVNGISWRLYLRHKAGGGERG